MSLKDQIEDYIGSFTDTAALDNWLTQGAKEIIRRLPDSRLREFASDVSVTTSGLDTGSYRVYYVHKAGYQSISMPTGLKAQIQDSDSIHYATSTSPAHLYDNGKLYVFPSGGTAVALEFPTVTNTDSTISSFPPEFVQAVILYASIQGVMYKMTEEITTVGNLTLSDISPPSAPTAPSFSYTDATGTTVSSTSIDISLLTKPTYSKPTVSLTAAPTDLSVSATKPTAPTDLLVSASLTETLPDDIDLTTAGITVPTAPTAPSFTSSTIPDETIVDPTDSILLGSVPTYTKPTVSLTTAPTDLSISATVPNKPPEPVFNYNDASASDFASSIVDGTVTAGISGLTAPTYTQPVSAPDWSQLESYIETEEDVELANSQLGKIQSEIQVYRADLYNNLNKFNGELEEYKADIQEKLEELRSKVQELSQEAQQTTDVNKLNAVKNLERQVSQYQFNLQKYASDLNRYQLEVNQEVQEHQENLTKWQSQTNNELQQYGLDIQNEQGNLNKELEIYKSTLQESIAQVDAALRQNTQQAQLNHDSDVKQAIQTLNEETQEYQAELQRYASEISAYQAEVNATIQEFRANFDKFTAKLREYETEINKEIQVQRTKIETFSTEVQSYSVTVNKELQEFQANLNKWSTERQTDLTQYQGDIQNELNEFNKEAEIYRQEINEKIQNAQLTQQRLLDDAQRQDNIELSNKAKDLERQISEYQSKLQKFNAEVQNYSAKVNEEVQTFNSELNKSIQRYQWYTQLLEQLRNEYKQMLAA